MKKIIGALLFLCFVASQKNIFGMEACPESCNYKLFQYSNIIFATSEDLNGFLVEREYIHYSGDNPLVNSLVELYVKEEKEKDVRLNSIRKKYINIEYARKKKKIEKINLLLIFGVLEQWEKRFFQSFQKGMILQFSKIKWA